MNFTKHLSLGDLILVNIFTNLLFEYVLLMKNAEYDLEASKVFLISEVALKEIIKYLSNVSLKSLIAFHWRLQDPTCNK